MPCTVSKCSVNALPSSITHIPFTSPHLNPATLLPLLLLLPHLPPHTSNTQVSEYLPSTTTHPSNSSNPLRVTQVLLLAHIALDLAVRGVA